MEMQRQPALSYGRIGGEAGLALTRVAFAAMVKHAGLYEDLEAVKKVFRGISASVLQEQDEKKRDKDVLELLKKDQRFDSIFDCWKEASKMRIWLSAKKQSLLTRFVTSDLSVEE